MDFEKLARPIYTYCLRRLGNSFDAQDLAQEILFEIFKSLPGTDVRDPEAWAWRIAHNRYAKFLNGRHRNWLSLDDNYEAVAENNSDSDAADAAFSALHAIAAEHRDILVDHYVYGLSCADIACQRGMNCSTVRSRLHYGRDKLKKKWSVNMSSNRIFSRLNWHIFGNGDINVSYLDRQISRAILSSCQNKYLTTEEISDLTGIPCMYIEDELEVLVEGEIINKRGNRYIAGVILYSEEYMKAVNAVLKACASDVRTELLSIIRDNMDKVRAVAFKGCDEKLEKMCWWLVPVMMRAACDRSREVVGFSRGELYPRIDGGSGWLVAYECTEGIRRYYAGCNNYYLANSRFRYFWTDKYLNKELVALLRRLEDISFNLKDNMLAAECVKCGIGVAENGEVKMNIPVFSKAQYEQLNEIVECCVGPVTQKLIPYAERLGLIMKKHAPEHLHGQIHGLFGIDFNAVIAVLCDMLEHDGCLEKPQTDIFAGQVIMIE